MQKSGIKALGKRKRGKYGLRDYVFMLSFSIVPILWFLLFYVYVNARGFAMAFENMDANGKLYFTFKNFADVIRDFGVAGNRIGEAVKNTAIMFLSGKFIALPISLAIAFFMLKGMAGSNFFKVAFYVPAMISQVANVYIFTYFVGVNGPLYEIFKLMGFNENNYPIMFYGDGAMASLVFYSIWGGMGFSVILHTAMMNRIPLDLFESAKLDGASFTAEFFNVVLPNIWSIIATEFITGLASCCSGAGLVLLTTKGKYGTYTVGYYMFEAVRYAGDPSTLFYPAAFGMLLSCVLVPLVMITRKVLYSFWRDAEV